MRSGLGVGFSSQAVQEWSDEINGGVRLLATRDAQIDADAAARQAQARLAQQQVKAQAAFRAGIGNDQAYALYMRMGGRGAGYGRAATPSLDLSITPSASVASSGATTFSMTGGGAGVSVGQLAVGAIELAGTSLINGVARIAAGAASVPAFVVGDTDAAVDYLRAAEEHWSIQPTSLGAQAITRTALLPVARRLAAGIQAGRDYSTDMIGDGPATALFAAGQIGLESWATATCRFECSCWALC
jgi:hypothetical protein